ncbi:MAG: hypothetical protein IPK32_09230 [Verrucomicrobiaceae bacterium]|nr:hypothetical protein [Verrucomicrobiaceae bacterium]
MSHYDPDLPAEIDLFGRRPFADRVAETMISRPLGDPLVVSIIGEWGSGKSTAMRYVKDRLAVLGKCKIAEFNPWRFSGEDVLIFELFSALVKAIDPELEVLTAWQGIKNGLAKHMDALKSMAGAFADLQSAGSGALATGALGFLSGQLRTQIEEVRAQARAHLEKSKWRIIVLLDDIDRLEASEILTLFRLIKLTADLPNTTYLLAMDEDHVSQIIGQRIDGDSKTGRSYLEKIINVRLSLPSIPDYKLRDYTFKLLCEVIPQSGHRLTGGEATRCTKIFDHLCMPMVTTPRKAKSLANAYRFALGMLPVGELNPVDLMLLESIRLLRPALHETIRKLMPRMMRGESLESAVEALFANEERRSKYKNQAWSEIITSIGEVTDREHEEVKSGLELWFPQLIPNAEGENHDEWSRDRRLCSKDYFWRYFSGAIQEDDVGDNIVGDWVSSLQPDNLPPAHNSLCAHLGAPYVAAFLGKLRLMVNDLQLTSKLPLIQVLAQAAKDTPNTRTGVFSGTYRNQSAEIAAETTLTLGSEESVSSAALIAIRASTDFGWSCAFLDNLPEYCRSKGSKTSGGIKWEPALVEQALAERVLKEFIEYPPDSSNSTMEMVCLIWRNRKEGETRARVTEIVTKRPDLALHFLAAGCGFSGTPDDASCCWTWKDKKSIRDISEIIDLEALRTALTSQVKELAGNGEVKTSSIFDREFQSLESIAWSFLNSFAREEPRKKLNSLAAHIPTGTLY